MPERRYAGARPVGLRESGSQRVLRFEYNGGSEYRSTRGRGMRALLLPVEQHAFVGSVFDTALLFARRFESYVEGVALSRNAPGVVSADVAMSLPARDEKSRAADIERCRELFASCIVRHGLDDPGEGPGGPSFRWSNLHFATDQEIGSYGRLFDVVVLGRPAPNGPRIETLEAALFESGRPVLVAPPLSPQTLGGKICIAWNKSSETAATVALAMPVLLEAREVVVLSLEGWGVDGPSGEALARCLERNGIAAEPVTRAMKSRSVGEAILDYASS